MLSSCPYHVLTLRRREDEREGKGRATPPAREGRTRREGGGGDGKEDDANGDGEYREEAQEEEGTKQDLDFSNTSMVCRHVCMKMMACMDLKPYRGSGNGA